MSINIIVACGGLSGGSAAACCVCVRAQMRQEAQGTSNNIGVLLTELS